MVLNSFLGYFKELLFRGYSWIQLIHIRFWHSRKENVRKTYSINYCQIWKKILVYQHNIIHTKEADSLFKCSWCRICNNFIYKSSHFNKYLLKCKYRMSHIWPKNMYQLQKVLFEMVEGFIVFKFQIKHFFGWTSFFNFESNCYATKDSIIRIN